MRQQCRDLFVHYRNLTCTGIDTARAARGRWGKQKECLEEIVHLIFPLHSIKTKLHGTSPQTPGINGLMGSWDGPMVEWGPGNLLLYGSLDYGEGVSSSWSHWKLKCRTCLSWKQNTPTESVKSHNQIFRHDTGWKSKLDSKFRTYVAP